MQQIVLLRGINWQISVCKKLSRSVRSSLVSTQIVREYLAVASRSSVTTGEPPLSEILDNVHLFRTQFSVLLNTEHVLDHLLGLIRSVPIAGRQVHDANIVATMQVYGVSHVLTHNTADFA
jgi:predicted nucleic acid-binding protein